MDSQLLLKKKLLTVTFTRPSSKLYKGSGLGLIGNIVVGIIGSYVGSKLLWYFGITLGSGWIGAILTGALGAIVILFLFNLIFKKK